jgi:hypothetical protein
MELRASRFFEADLAASHAKDDRDAPSGALE